MNEAPDISIVVPLYRSRSTLAELVSRLGAVLEARGVEHEIVFVDDACPDGSGAALEILASDSERIRVLRHDHNRGQNEAVLTGLEAARGRTVVVMDADLQDPPEAIPLLLDSLADGIDAVFAGRRGSYESRTRMLTSRVHKGVLHVVSGRRVPLDAGLFVAMSRRMVDRIVSARASNPYVIALMGRTGLTMISVPVVRASRQAGRSAYTFSKRARLAWRAVTIALSRGGPE